MMFAGAPPPPQPPPTAGAAGRSVEQGGWRGSTQHELARRLREGMRAADLAFILGSPPAACAPVCALLGANTEPRLPQNRLRVGAGGDNNWIDHNQN
jgi:hypothetical protein